MPNQKLNEMSTRPDDSLLSLVLRQFYVNFFVHQFFATISTILEKNSDIKLEMAKRGTVSVS